MRDWCSTTSAMLPTACGTVYERTDHRDGYACLEVSPHLVNDTGKTIREARRLWQALDRPNVMIKVPATRAGLVAMATLLTEGINVNITLLFSLPVYRQVADTYVRALEQRSANGDDPAKVASVASFYVSRIDTVFDKLVNALVARGVFQDVYMDLSSIRGQVATATAKVAYQYYKEIFSGARWDALAAQGAATQRLLWASTGVKNARLFRSALCGRAARPGHGEYAVAGNPAGFS